MPNQTCCPSGYSYIVNAAYPNGTCQSFAAPFTYEEPIDCPCCPEGYTWNSNIEVRNVKGACVNLFGQTTSSIPCITCVCTTIVPNSCPNCGTGGQKIAFVYNFFTRNCTTCNTTTTPPKGNINCFLPNSFTSIYPIGFQLKP